MPSLLPKKRKSRVIVVLTALLVLGVLGFIGGKKIAWPYFKTWRETRANQEAQAFLDKGDYNNALLAARKTLAYNQFNIEAWRLAVATTEKQGSTDVIYYQQRLASLDPSLDNKLKFLRLAVKFNAYPQAMDMISKMGSEASQSPEFFEIAANVSRRMGNPTKARYYLMSLIGLKPNDNEARYELAQLRLFDGVNENKPSLRAEIRNLASDPEIRPRALSLLLAEAIESKNATEALEIADQLSASVNLLPASEILLADTYRRFAPAKLEPYIKKLEQAYTDDVAKITLLTNYLTGNDNAAEAKRWIDSLPDKPRGTESVQVSYAFALFTLRQWDDLTSFLRGSKWLENEYARHALLAYRYRAIGDDRNFNEEWKLALIEAGANPRRMQTLISQVTSWNWPDQRIELLWKLFTVDPRNEKVRRELMLWEKSRGNTANLNRIFARIVELEPGDTFSRNNYAYTSLLLNQNLDRAYRMVRENYEADHKNAFFVTAYAFALLREGKNAEALAAIESLNVGDFSQPERNLMHAVILVANGRYDEGASLAGPLKPSEFLPEERALLADAQASIEKSHREQEGVARLASINNANAGSNVERKSWLSVMPGGFNKSPAVQMELADTFYAADDFKGLESNIKGEKWDKNDYLRLALLSYAQRHLNNPGDARDSWRFAVASAGNIVENLKLLSDLAEHWSWNSERIEILNRIYQRDPSDSKAFNELVDHYAKNNQTAELARVYGQRSEANPSETDTLSRLAYYSLITGTQISRAHILAKQAYDRATTDVFAQKVYALSLLKQGRGSEGWRLLQDVPEKRESGMAQIGLLKAALASDQGKRDRARELLALFDSSSALPEEITLSESVAKAAKAEN